MSHQAPALICSVCIKELNKAVKFRKKCIESENHFKSLLLTFEPFIWNDELQMINSGYNNDRSIKEEPQDFRHLFDNFTSIIEENRKIDDLNLFNVDKSDDEINKPVYPVKKRRVKQSIKYENSDPDFESEYQCHLCLKTFTKLHSMKDHMRAVHQKLEESEMFKCEHCDKLFKLRYYLSK